MKTIATFGAAALLFSGVHAAYAQTANFAIRSTAGFTLNVVNVDPISTARVQKAISGLLQVTVDVKFDPSVTRVVMIGPTGLITYIRPASGATTASVGQGWSPVYSPLGLYTFKVKFYSATGLVISTKQLKVNVVPTDNTGDISDTNGGGLVGGE